MVLDENIEIDVCLSRIKKFIPQESSYLVVVNQPKENSNHSNSIRLSEKEIGKLIDDYNIMKKPANTELIGKPALLYYQNNKINRILGIPEETE